MNLDEITFLTKELFNILLIEDNDGDIRLTQETLQEHKIKANLHVSKDGEDAYQFLKKMGRYEMVTTPDLILLDLNLPKKDGRSLLKDIKGDNELKRIPVIILTTSKEEEDVIKTYDLHANAYIVKPVDLTQFVEIIKRINNFWFSVVKLPYYRIKKNNLREN